MGSKSKDGTIPDVIEVQLVTPEIAKEWLDTRFDDERPLRQSHVERLARDMRDDNWVFNGDPIRFDRDTEKLTDGQHRLKAQVVSDTSQYFAIIDLPTEARATFDTNVPRSLGDAIHYDSFGKEVGVGSHITGRELAALINRLLRYKVGLGTSGGGVYKPTHAEGLEFFREHADRLMAALVVAKKTQQSDLPAAPSSLAAAYHLCAEVNQKQADDFFVNRIVGGLGLTKGDPAAAYRGRLLKYHKTTGYKLPADDVFRFALVAWNHERKGNRIEKLQGPRGGWRPDNLPSPR